MTPKYKLFCTLLVLVPLIITSIVIMDLLNPKRSMSTQEIVNSYGINIDKITEGVSWDYTKQEIRQSDFTADYYSLLLKEDKDLPVEKGSNILKTYRKGDLDSKFVLLATNTKEINSQLSFVSDENRYFREALYQFSLRLENDTTVNRYNYEINKEYIDMLGWYDSKSQVYVVIGSSFPQIITSNLPSLSLNGGSHKELSFLNITYNGQIWKYISPKMENFNLINFALESDEAIHDEELAQDNPTGEGLEGYVCKTGGGGLNLRLEPKKSSDVIIVMSENYEITYYELKDDFFKVTDDYGREGWASKNYICKGKAPKVEGPHICNTGGMGVIVRAETNTSSTETARMIEGALVTVEETSGGWKKVKDQLGGEGWVPSEYICE